MENKVVSEGAEAWLPSYELEPSSPKLSLVPVRDISLMVAGEWPFLAPSGEFVFQAKNRLVRVSREGKQTTLDLPEGHRLTCITEHGDFLFEDTVRHLILRTAPDLRFKSSFPLPKPGILATDRYDNVYVWLTYAPSIEKFSPAGNKLAAMPALQESMDMDFTFDLRGDLWVSDSSLQTVYQVVQERYKAVSTPDEQAIPDPDRQSLFSYPTRILPDPENNLWIINGDGWRTNDITVINRERTRYYRFDPLKAAGIHPKDAESGKVQVLVSRSDDTLAIVDFVDRVVHLFKVSIDFGTKTPETAGGD